ncbi:type II toxin-antitoxin system RelE/ParE family toxin [Ketobacter sp.]
MKLKFTPVALRDLKRLRQFIAIHDPQAARRYSERLKQSLKHLTKHPDMGKPIEEPLGVRELVAGDYVARYLVKETDVIVLKIRHEKEEW